MRHFLCESEVPEVTDTAWYFPPFKLLFPAVTFCNQNRVNCERVRSLLRSGQEDQRLTWIEDNLCKDRNVWKKLDGARNHSGGPDGPTLSPLEREFIFLQNYMSLNESVRISIGHDFPSFMKNCTFRGKNCLNIRSVWWDLTLLQPGPLLLEEECRGLTLIGRELCQDKNFLFHVTRYGDLHAPPCLTLAFLSIPTISSASQSAL